MLKLSKRYHLPSPPTVSILHLSPLSPSLSLSHWPAWRYYEWPDLAWRQAMGTCSTRSEPINRNLSSWSPFIPTVAHLTSHLPRTWSTSVSPPPQATSTPIMVPSASKGRCGHIDREDVGDRWRWIEGARGERWRGQAGEGG